VSSEGSQNLATVTEPEPIIAPGHSLESVTDKISAIVLTRPTTPGWVFGFLISFALLMLFNLVVTMLMVKGVGIFFFCTNAGAQPLIALRKR
jgi:hypothetical protein